MSAGSLSRTFLDSNLFVYTDDLRAPEKQTMALKVIEEHRNARTGVVSLQVLQEYYYIATKKIKVDPTLARRKVEIFARFDVAIASVDDILAAIDLQRLHGLSFWDSLIVRMAKESGCRVLLTEDMQHQRELDGVKIINPFV
jgi:predicted nucleic acid-binding protein